LEGGLVDIYESFIALTIFSQGHFDDKIRAVFVVFDIDGGGSIDRKELSKFLLASIVGICKLLGLPSPSFLGI
jgi:Ca2+-binding EF-hand superfamily protein